MKRRIFIKNTITAGASAALMPSMGFKAFANSDFPGDYQLFMLKNFEDEQEECPSIVTDQNGNAWIFTLRRLSYPQDKEVISSFRFNGDNWEEMNPVTQKAGHYEAPVSACAVGGKPIVAWCEIISGKWQINISSLTNDGFEKPVKISGNKGKPINPVLLAPDKNRCWIAWENYEKGRFNICISKFENAAWSRPVVIDKGENSCFNPALAESKNGDLYVAYGLTDGFHQNIEMSILDGQSMEIKSTVPVAIGGSYKNRVNLNSNPAIEFDALDRLWISYESNRKYIGNHTDNDRMEAGGDNFMGDRICAMLSYQDGKLLEPEKNGKWLFSDKSDHSPVFFKDKQGRLYAATHCGGDFEGNRFWKYRIAWLDPEKGWTEPEILLETKQQGVLMKPALAFDGEKNFWLATCIEEVFNHKEPENYEGIIRSRLTKLVVCQNPIPKLTEEYAPLALRQTKVEEHHENENFIPETSGHPKIEGEEIRITDKTFSLIYGNLHEHSENSSCWPAGVDGTLHDNYRFGMFSEGYNFVAITDHGYLMTEVYWRKNLRIADFYNDPPYFVALPAMEWTKRTDQNSEQIELGSGHYNVIFASTEDARKFIRNRHEIYSVISPETLNSKMLWEFLHRQKINCITIPHHPVSSIHRMDWEVHDDHYAPVVELFQVRGNNEYPDCPRLINYQKFKPSNNKKVYVNYALKEKKYKMGFIASGDHTGMGVGVAAVWIKEFDRSGILEAMRERRCFATTGDKIIVDFRINGAINGSVTKTDKAPVLDIKVKAQRELEKIDILRNSKVIKTYSVQDGSINFDKQFRDEQYMEDREFCYYYIRATQKNNELAWSSPIWVVPV